MSQVAEKSAFMLFFHHPSETVPCNQQELVENFEKGMAWIDSLRAQGLSLGGRPLEAEGRVLRPKGASPTDGPYAEGKEVVGGYITILARDLDEASAIAQTCPHLQGNLTIEIRQVMRIPERYVHLLS